MRAFFRGRTPPAAALAAVTAAAILLAGSPAPAGLPGPEELPIMGWEAAEAALLGLPRKDIFNAWGEPDGSLSGFFGDIYQLESGMCITVYYDPEPMNRGLADSYTVPVQYISCPVKEIPPLEEAGLSPRLSLALEGHTREEVHAAWGDPHREVTTKWDGLCDVYWPDRLHGITIYYDTESMDAGTADERTVTVLYVSRSEE